MARENPRLQFTDGEQTPEVEPYIRREVGGIPMSRLRQKRRIRKQYAAALR